MLIRADARSIPLADNSIHCCVTSPPYWGLRQYGTGSWEGGDPDCEHSGGGRGGSGSPGKNTRGAMNTSSPARGGSNTCVKCGAVHVDAQIGCEGTPDEFVANILRVFREVHRVLRPDGTVWLNLGDSYAADRGGSEMPAETLAGGVSGVGDEDAHRGRNGKVPRRDCKRYGLKHKDLCGIPWRVAFAMQGFALVPIDEIARLCRAIDSQDLPALQAFRAGFRLWEELSDMGWFWHRSDIIWSKRAPMPESVTDRPTKSHEYLFLMTKSDRYFYDAEAVKENFETDPKENYLTRARITGRGGQDSAAVRGNDRDKSGGFPPSGGGRNRRSVWTINPQAFSWEACKACRRTYNREEYNGLPVADGSLTKKATCRCGRSDEWLSHFATFPSEIPTVAILAGTSAKGCCAKCGSPLDRVLERPEPMDVDDSDLDRFGTGKAGVHRKIGTEYEVWRRENPVKTVGWNPTCSCDAPTVPCRVLDPFVGAGTSVKVARELGREGIGLDYSWDYLQLLAKRRIIVTMGLGL